MGAGAAEAAAAGAERMSIAVTPEAIRHRPAPAAEWGSTLATDAWLVSARADFWIVAAGGASLLLVMGLVLLWHGDRELDTADLLLSELHLGATYDAIVRRRLWRTMPLEVLLVPLALVAATYALVLNGWPLLVTTAILYLGAWHRGRQNLGIARYYQRRVGGPVSPGHRWRLAAAFYLPMLAGVAYYTSTAATHEGEDFHHLTLPAELHWALGAVAAAGVAAYLVWTRGRVRAMTGPAPTGLDHAPAGVHPAERWLVLANAVAFGSAYVVGAWAASFVLVLAVHHEVQYLYFTYAVARRADAGRGARSRRRAPPARPVRGVAGDRSRLVGGVHALRIRVTPAVPDRRPPQPLLAGRPHLDGASPSSGRRVAHARRARGRFPAVKPSVNWLLALIPVTLALEHGGAPAPWVFFIAAIAILPVARLIVRSHGAASSRLSRRHVDALGVIALRHAPRRLVSVGPRIAGRQRARQLVQGSAARDRLPDHRAHVLPPPDGVVIVPPC